MHRAEEPRIPVLEVRLLAGDKSFSFVVGHPWPPQLQWGALHRSQLEAITRGQPSRAWRGAPPLAGPACSPAILSFIASFGVVKALSNLFAGRLGDRIGRKGVLIAGRLVGLPAPLIIMFAPSWGWIIFAIAAALSGRGHCVDRVARTELAHLPAGCLDHAGDV